MPERFPPELIKGTTELLVLGLLEAGDLHGYGILKRLRELSGERLRINEGALYPLLHRLVREGKVDQSTSRVGGRERKVYRLTQDGRSALAEAGERWRAYVAFVARVLDEGPGPGPRGRSHGERGGTG